MKSTYQGEQMPGGERGQLEQKLELLAINTEEPIVIVGLDLVVVAFNGQFYRQYAAFFGGYIEKGKSILDFARLNSVAGLRAIYARAFTGLVQEREFTWQAADKTLSTFLIKYKPVFSEPGKVVGACALFVDITEKVNSHKQLAINQNRYNTLVESISDGFVAFDKNGCYTYVNKKAAALIRHEPHELIGRNVWDVFPEAVGSATYEAFHRALTEQVHVVNTDYYEPLQLWQENHFYPSPEGVSLFIRDITERKRTEENLRIAKERYDIVAKATNEAIWDWDVVTNDLHWGEGFKNLFGYETSEGNLSLNSWINHIHPEDAQEVYESIKSVVNSPAEHKWQHEYRYIKADGNPANVLDRGFVIRDKKGRAIKMVGAMQDITRQKEEEQRLKLLESVITNATDAAIITEAHPFDAPGPKIVYVNAAFTKMTGYTKEEIIGQTPHLFQGPDTDRAELDRLKSAITAQQACDVEIVNYTRNGVPYWVEISMAPVTDASGRVSHFIAIERNITSRKLQEQEREKLINELTQNNLDLRQFSYITSHNLRGPIASLLGLCTLIDDYKIEDSTLKQILDGVKKATFMFDETIHDLTTVLNIRDRTSIPREDMQFIVSFEKTVMQLGTLIEEGHAALEADFLRAPLVNYNKAYLESVFTNLITNAIKYRSPARPLKIRASTEDCGSYVVMRFSDNGLGIDTEMHREKIFRLHQRFHDHTDGKGLGLFLVKSQMESLGGSIDIESKVGAGTTFILKFRK